MRARPLLLAPIILVTTAPGDVQARPINQIDWQSTTSVVIDQAPPSWLPPQQRSPGNISNPLLRQEILSVTPSVGGPATDVVIGGKQSFANVTAVHFGNLPAASFSLQPDGTVLAASPYAGVGGSTVPVTVTSGSEAWSKPSAYSYPIAELSVTGPLPYEPSSDPFDTRWYNGAGHAMRGLAPPVLSFTTPPVLHVHTVFNDDSITWPASYPPNGRPPYAVGNYATYQAWVESCEVTNAVPSGPTACTNWDGNQGTWTKVGIAADGQLDSPHPNGTAQGDLALPIAQLFDDQNFVRTLRLYLHIQQLDTNTATAASHRIDGTYTAAFSAVVSPTALIQLKLVPYTIVYQPPGDASTSNYQTTATYSIAYKIGNSNQQNNISLQSSSKSQQASVSLSGPPAGSGSASGGSGSASGGAGSGSTPVTLSGGYTFLEKWDDSTKTNFGTTNGNSTTATGTLALQTQFLLPANPKLVPGNGVTCASATDCTNLSQPADPVVIQPFWSDTFFFLVHPQFAAWVIPAGGTRYVMLGAVPVLAEASVAQLMACWKGMTDWPGATACDVPYVHNLTAADGSAVVYQGTGDHVTLTADEAAAFLLLDPFVQGQAHAVDTTRAIPIASYPYGTQFHDQPRPVTTTLTRTQAQADETTAQTSTTLTVTSMQTSSDNVDLSETFYNVLKLGATISDSSAANNEWDAQTTFNNSTVVTTTNATQAQVTLNDLDSTTSGAHLPLPQRPGTNVFLDKVFGGFMFQDPAAAPNPDAPQAKPALWRLLKQYSETARLFAAFADVQAGTDQAEAIGVLTRTGVLGGVDAGHFSPNAALSRIDLAAAIDSALSPPTPGGQAPSYSDLPRGARVAEIAARVTAAKLVTPRSSTLFGPSDHVTRGELASSLATAFHPAAAPTTASNTPFTNLSSALDSVVAAGWMKKRADGNLATIDSVTRGEAAEALYSALVSHLEASH